MNKMAAELELLPGQAEELCKAASAALNLCASIAVSTAQIAAWQQLIHCNIWLHLSSIPDNMKKELLDGPISPEGLFGPHLHSVVDQLHKTSEEAERFRSHVARAQRDACPQCSSGHWRDRRDQRQRLRLTPLLLLLLLRCHPRRATKRLNWHLGRVRRTATWPRRGLIHRKSLRRNTADSNVILGGCVCIGEMFVMVCQTVLK